MREEWRNWKWSSQGATLEQPKSIPGPRSSQGASRQQPMSIPGHRSSQGAFLEQLRSIPGAAKEHPWSSQGTTLEQPSSIPEAALTEHVPAVHDVHEWRQDHVRLLLDRVAVRRHSALHLRHQHPHLVDTLVDLWLQTESETKCNVKH